MLVQTLETLNNNKKTIVHNDWGTQYRWPGWIIQDKKGCSPDNVTCEVFFGKLKNEIFYNNTWINVTLDEFIEKLSRYIYWYSMKQKKDNSRWIKSNSISTKDGV